MLSYNSPLTHCSISSAGENSTVDDILLNSKTRIQEPRIASVDDIYKGSYPTRDCDSRGALSPSFSDSASSDYDDGTRSLSPPLDADSNSSSTSASEELSKITGVNLANFNAQPSSIDSIAADLSSAFEALRVEDQSTSTDHAADLAGYVSRWIDSISKEEDDNYEYSQEDWVLTQKLPRNIFDDVWETLPIQAIDDGQTLLNLLPEMSLPLPPTIYTSSYQLLQDYHAYLDLRDQLWVEQAILRSLVPNEGDHRDEMCQLDGVEAQIVGELVSTAIKKTCAVLFSFEFSFSMLSNEFCFLRFERFNSYPDDHPLQMIQAYLPQVVPDFRWEAHAAAKTYFEQLQIQYQFFQGWAPESVIYQKGWLEKQGALE